MIKMSLKEFRQSLDRIKSDSNRNRVPKLRNLSSKPIQAPGARVWTLEMSFGWPLEAPGSFRHLSRELVLRKSRIRTPRIPCGRLDLDSDPTCRRSNNFQTPNPRGGYTAQRIQTLESPCERPKLLSDGSLRASEMCFRSSSRER